MRKVFDGGFSEQFKGTLEQILHDLSCVCCKGTFFKVLHEGLAVLPITLPFETTSTVLTLGPIQRYLGAQPPRTSKPNLDDSGGQ